MNIDTIQNDFIKTTTNIYLYVIFNWATISQDEHIQRTLDVNTNSMCRKLKLQNPNMRDEFIQAHTYTLLLMMIFMTMIPMTDMLNANIPDYVLNYANDTEDPDDANDTNTPSIDTPDIDID
jgi:hypothetical protein